MNAVRNSGFHLYAICSSRGMSAGVVCVFSAKITGAWFEYSVKSPILKFDIRLKFACDVSK